MKRGIIIIVSVFCISCATNPSQKPIPKMVPDHTPYIAGLIEFSPDTTHHYPEIIVGYFTDVYEDQRVRYAPGVLRNYPGIYSPTLLRQLVQTSILYGLQWEPEMEAIVKVQGPLGTAKERTVTFAHERKGIYGDSNYALSRIPNGRYRLKVILPDGRAYTAITHIPKVAPFIIPDSISVKVRYEPYGDGTPREEDVQPYSIIYQTPESCFLKVLQYNSSLDREIMLMKPEEQFRFTDRSNYLRTGVGYAVALPAGSQQDTLSRSWIQRLDKPKDKIWMKKHWWLCFSFFSEGIGKIFHPLIDAYFVANKAFIEQMLKPFGHAATQNDSTFLFEASTIRKVGPDGAVIPKDSSDAIGFFAGYFSIYRQTTFYPIRTFDLDSVLIEYEGE